MDMTADHQFPEPFAHCHERSPPISQQKPGTTPEITLEKVQMDMYIAFNSFMQLQSAYQAKIQVVEKELAKNVQEASSLREDVDVLSDWAKAVLEYFGNDGASKDAKAGIKAQDPVA
ncbi:hypothetical protein EJ07DRAFT_182969 [Lizonia empirigonia]|nr:hypothetical protein EJ07DRAFT_182969 [Lizonia empirigonia]